MRALDGRALDLPALPTKASTGGQGEELGPEAMREVARRQGVDEAAGQARIDQGCCSFARAKVLGTGRGTTPLRREAEPAALMPPQEARRGKYVGNTRVVEERGQGSFILRNVTPTMRILRYDQFGEPPEEAGAETTTTEATLG